MLKLQSDRKFKILLYIYVLHICYLSIFLKRKNHKKYATFYYFTVKL